MKFYTYEKEIGDLKILIGIIRENPINKILINFVNLLRMILVVYMFYFNSYYIHSKLLSFLLFIIGIISVLSLSLNEKLSSKEIFLEKVEELTKDDNP